MDAVKSLKLQKRKEKFLEAVEIAEKSKKQIIGFIQNLISQLNSRKITREEYEEKLSRALKNRTAEQWISYYDSYINFYKKQISICEERIKKTKKRSRKITLILITFIVLIAISSFFTLYLSERNFLKIIGEKISSIFQPSKISEVSITLNDKESVLSEEPLIQYQAVVGKSVKWKKNFVISKETDLILKLPMDSKNIKLKKIENKEEQDLSFSVEERLFIEETEVKVEKASESKRTGLASEERGEYKVEYETPAPEISELEAEGSVIKRVLIKGPDNVHYKDVLSFAELPREFNEKEIGRLKLYEIKNNQRTETRFIAYDTDKNGLVDYIEWLIPELSEAVFELVIEISKAEHLNENKEFISDIYEQVKALDGNWSEPIPAEHYVRVTFKKNLTKDNDITIYARASNHSNNSEECYDKETQILAEDGWKYFYELGESERVMTLNSKTGEKEWQLPLERQEFEHDKEMYKIVLEDENGKESELVVSEEHKVYVGEREKEYQYNNNCVGFNLSVVGSTSNPSDCKTTTPSNTLSTKSEIQTGKASSLPLTFIHALPLDIFTIPAPVLTSSSLTDLIPNSSASAFGSVVKLAPVSTSALTTFECFLSKSDSPISTNVCPIMYYNDKDYINFSNFKLQLITETYQDLQEGREIYFLDGNNKPIKVKSITKQAYNGKIYDVDVENDIVLVRKKNEGESGKALWSGNSNPQSAQIEVYRKDDNTLIAKFENISDESWHKVYLTNLSENESYETFDLKVVGVTGIEFDYIVDPIQDLNPIVHANTRLNSAVLTQIQVNAIINDDAANIELTKGDLLTTEFNDIPLTGTLNDASCSLTYFTGYAFPNEGIFSVYDSFGGNLLDSITITQTTSDKTITLTNLETKGLSLSEVNTIIVQVQNIVSRRPYSIYIDKISCSINNNLPSQITYLQPIPPQTPIENSITTIVFEVRVNDSDGVNDINDSSVNMQYYDGAGTWNISVYAEDLNRNPAINETVTFQYNLLKAIVISPPEIIWPEIIQGAKNQTPTIPTTINNTGNYNATGRIAIQSMNLYGETDNLEYIDAGNFTVDIDPGEDSCAGFSLINGTNITITNSILESGNLSAGESQEQVYYCLKEVPLVSSQTYSTQQAGGWIITILIASVIIKKKKQKARELKTNLKKDALSISLNLLSKELKQAYSEEKEKIAKLLIKEIKKKYRINNKETAELIKTGKEEIPLEIFSRELGALESVTKYMKENLGMNYHKISLLLNRDERTIWTAYHKSRKKQKEPIIIKGKNVFLPVSIFNKKLTILESVIVYLKKQGKMYSEIAKLLNRDQRNIWTIYSRAVKKIKSKV